MSFEDLPDDWPDRPLTEPRLVADVLDLVVKKSDRCAGALALLLCDPQGRLMQPVVIDRLPPRPHEAQCCHIMSTIVSAMAGQGSLVVAIARREGLSITAGDRIWARAAEQVCGAGVRLLGVHLLTMNGSRAVPVPSRAA